MNAASGPPPVPAEPTVWPLTEMGKPPGQWTLTLHPAHLALAESPGAQPYVILREEMMNSVMLMERMRVLSFSKPRKWTFKLTPEGTSALAEWIGKSVLASHYLKRRYAWVLPVAALWIIGSLPLPGDSAGRIEPVPFDPIGLVLGLTLVASWAFARWRPHPVLFLVDSLWFLAMAGHLVVGVMNGRSKLWFVLVAFLLWMVVTGLTYFRRFRRTDLKTPAK